MEDASNSRTAPDYMEPAETADADDRESETGLLEGMVEAANTLNAPNDVLYQFQMFPVPPIAAVSCAILDSKGGIRHASIPQELAEHYLRLLGIKQPCPEHSIPVLEMYLTDLDQLKEELVQHRLGVMRAICMLKAVPGIPAFADPSKI